MKAFTPLFKPAGGRMVNVSSTAGVLNKYPSEIAQRFRNASSVDDVTTLMEEFKSAVANGTHTEAGWPSAAYAVSKAGLTGMTKVLARDIAKKQQNLLVNSCCPGWVKTDMTKGKGTKTLDQGAQTPVLLALGDINGTTGEFWRDEKVQPW
jgi:carbonyl reductase 1